MTSDFGLSRMELKQALVVWGEYDHRPGAALPPKRMRQYLDVGKCVYHAPTADIYGPEFLMRDEFELILTRGGDDGQEQSEFLIQRLRVGNVTEVELIGPRSNFCLPTILIDLKRPGIEAKINMDYSTPL